MRARFSSYLAVLLIAVQVFAADNPNGSDSSSTSAVSFPRVIRFSGVLPGSGTAELVGVTFALYQDQTGGAPLWQETQNVRPDSAGHYSVLLGSTQKEGLPADLFAGNVARWLGVRVEGGDELARVLLASVPYAMKAGDAETLGGQPLSAFVLNTANAGTGAATKAITSESIAAAFTAPSPATSSVTITMNCLAMFSDNVGTVTNANVCQSATGVVGINTTNPNGQSNAKLHVNGNLLLYGQPTHQVQMIGTASAGRLGEDSSGFFFASDTQNRSIRFLTTPLGGALTTQMYIQPNGSVSIGTTAATNKLTVAGTIQSTSGGFVFPDASVQTKAINSIVGASQGGITANTSAGTVTLSADTSVVQQRVTGTCAAGAIFAIKQDGSVNCVIEGSGGSGPQPNFMTLLGDGPVDDASYAGLIAGRLISAYPLAITRVSIDAGVPGSGVCSPALARITNDSIFEDIPVGALNSTYDTGDHAMVFPAGTAVKLVLLYPAFCGLDYNNYYAGNQTGFTPQELSGTIRYELAQQNEATSCPGNLTLVNGSCLDLTSDPENCGTAGHACGHVANMFPTCTNGVCGTGACKYGFNTCSGTACAVNTQSDSNNCGYCGSVCPKSVSNGTTTGCTQGQCTFTCSQGYAACPYNGAGCFNLNTDMNHCGNCNRICSGNANNISCMAGQCNGSCNAGDVLCAQPSGYLNCISAASLASDPYNCGGCNIHCASGVCSQGQCQ